MTTNDLFDSVVGVWQVIFAAVTPPAQIQTQWFTHPTGDQRLVRAQAWIRHRADDTLVDLTAGAAELEGRGWRVATDQAFEGGRLRGRNGHVYVELQRRSGGLVLLRAQSGYLCLVELGSELVGSGTGERVWP